MSTMVKIVRGCHLGANQSHTHENQSNEERLNEDQSYKERPKKNETLSVLDLPPEMMLEIGSHLDIL